MQDLKTDQKQSTKVCKECGKLLPLEDFHRQATGRHGRLSICKVCRNTKKYRKTKAQRRAAHLRYMYGISVEYYEELLVNQSECCAICFEHESCFKKPLVVDHNHETGKVRGLLCDGCNSALGLFKDSPDNLRNAAAYLESRGYYG